MQTASKRFQNRTCPEGFRRVKTQIDDHRSYLPCSMGRPQKLSHLCDQRESTQLVFVESDSSTAHIARKLSRREFNVAQLTEDESPPIAY
ncbi:hypothetical protein L596_010971 [Steinernema carpocapsae]|uniref:Uncharacterized protein n=1 Tax=Steinernema carpocapsae TaxID=34508 RepID=A0A4U5NSQ6_STECR|nr:hypothetical protein L596_010971 [Steinernema carpocapsae]